MSAAPYVIFGRPYERDYDVIIIGSGIGGLICGNLLAKNGVRVLLLERHFVLGGFCSSFRRNGFLFDAATHFYPLLGNPTTLTGKLLKDIDCPTEWIKMDPVDQFHFPGKPPFAVPCDLVPYLERLKSWFPDEAHNIDAYFNELRQAYMYGLLYYFKRIPNEQAEKLRQFTVTQKLDQYFKDPALKAVLMGDTAHWGSVPDRTSYLFDAMLRMSYFLGNYYPKGSSQAFADDLGRGLTSRGGRVLKCAEATRIVVEGGKAVGVEVKTLSKRAAETFHFRAPIVVSNGDALHTYRDLIGEHHCGRWLIDSLEAMKPSLPCFLVHMGLRGMDPKRLADAEGYYWSNFDARDTVQNVFKVFIPTHYDPTIAPPGCQVLIIQKLVPVDFDNVPDWQAHKMEVEGRIMARLRGILPELEDHTVVRMSATAMTSFRFTYNYRGAMLGWEMTPGQLGADRLPPTTPIENLYLTGHWTQPGGGITPVIISAQRVARMILTGKADDERALAQQYFSFRAPHAPTQDQEVPKS